MAVEITDVWVVILQTGQMKTVMQRAFMRIVVMFVIATSIFAAPLANALHIETSSIDFCVVEGVQDLANRGHADHEHDGHLHQCAQCHVHFHLGNRPPRSVVAKDGDNYRLPLSSRAISASISPLLQPPKA